MPLPPFVRSPAFLGGLGSAGSGVLGIGGWQIYEESYPTADRQLSRENFYGNIPKPQLEADVGTGEHKDGESLFKFQSYGCFQNFFPGATVNHSLETNSTATDPFNKPSGDDISSNVDPIGCALMNFSYEVEVGSASQGESKKIKYVFKSEVTVKNDKFGWSLWAGSKKLTTTGASEGSWKNEQTYYYLLFLKRISDAWGILGGYSWKDATFSAGTSTSNVSIWSPNRDEGNWYSPISNSSEGKHTGFKEYSGIWEIESDAKNEIFQDIEFWAGNESDKYDSDEILGRGFKKDTSYIDFSKESTNYMGYGYEETEYVYESSSGWTKMSVSSGKKGKDITQTLNEMYVPFKGKKGKWKEIEKHCDSQKFKRGTPKEDLYKLKSFCYKKQ